MPSGDTDGQPSMTKPRDRPHTNPCPVLGPCRALRPRRQYSSCSGDRLRPVFPGLSCRFRPVTSLCLGSDFAADRDVMRLSLPAGLLSVASGLLSASVHLLRHRAASGRADALYAAAARHAMRVSSIDGLAAGLYRASDLPLSVRPGQRALNRDPEDTPLRGYPGSFLRGKKDICRM